LGLIKEKYFTKNINNNYCNKILKFVKRFLSIKDLENTEKFGKAFKK